MDKAIQLLRELKDEFLQAMELLKLLEEEPDEVMRRETDYHKQKELEKKNPVFKRGDRK